MNDHLKPVPTPYLGIPFRSTLEANWAATLDSLRIAWRYEPTPVTLPDGTGYLPDFHLPEIGTWLEVKGPDVPGEEKARAYAQMLACHCEGRCECEWEHGEIVLLGYASFHPVGENLKFGAAYWMDALGGNALLGTCLICRRTCWVRPRHSFRCRNCGANEPNAQHFDHLRGTGQIEFRRAGKFWAVA